MKTSGVKLDLKKINASFPYEKKNVRQRRPLSEGFFQVERLLTRKRDGVSKIDMHDTPCGISSGLKEKIIKTKMHVRTSTVILTCYNSMIKQ